MAKLHLSQEIFDLIYPVGSIYISDNTTNPSTYFGGTWIRIVGGFLYGSTITTANTNVYSGGNIGSGTATNSHTLTINQIPSHIHKGLNWIDEPSGEITLNSGSAKGYNLPYNGGLQDGQRNNIWTKSAGGGQGHSHNIPYLACAIWKRTA